ncbi:MAG: hypothetical protein K2I03_05950, partial [Lachnospiraceae bacterium]|nr:hypothetical protein [Lachnospiraceae bacterium]
GKYGYQFDAAGNNGLRLYCFETSPWKYVAQCVFFSNDGTLNASKLKENNILLEDKYAALSHTHNYLPLTGGTLSGTIKTSGSAGFNAGDKVKMWTDNEGGNFEITSNTGTTSWQQDALGDVFRIYQHNNTTGANYFPISMSGYNVTINTLNISNTLNGYNIGGSVTKNNNGLITGGNVYNALGNIQIVEIMNTGILSTSAAIANAGTAVLSTSFEMWEGSTNYIAIPTLFRYCSIESISVSGSKLNITVRNTSGASHTLSASFQIIYYKYK